MPSPSEASRWSMGPAVAVPTPPLPARRMSRRDLVAILAGSAAIAVIGVALSDSNDTHDGVALRRGTPSASSSSGIAPADGGWDGMPAATLAPRPIVADLPLVAATEAEHIAQTQGFAQVMMPRLRDGQVTGFTIRDGALPPVFAHAGVRTGDVLVSVNGRTLNSNALVSTLSHELAGARRADIVVERGGRQERLSVGLTG